MRKVHVFKWEMEGRQAVRVPDGEGVFHSFGIAYEQIDFGVGQFTTAIIERSDGKLHNVALELVQFCEPL